MHEFINRLTKEILNTEYLSVGEQLMMLMLIDDVKQKMPKKKRCRGCLK